MEPEPKSPHPIGAPGPVVLAVASAGGAWVQLKRLLPAFDHCKLVVATVSLREVDPVACAARFDLPETDRAGLLGVGRLVWKLVRLMLRTRPAVVVTTGDLHGAVAIRLGKWMGARTIWLESIAHIERVSPMGQRVYRCADLWLTQWSHLETPEGPRSFGPVL